MSKEPPRAKPAEGGRLDVGHRRPGFSRSNRYRKRRVPGSGDEKESGDGAPMGKPSTFV